MNELQITITITNHYSIKQLQKNVIQCIKMS